MVNKKGGRDWGTKRTKSVELSEDPNLRICSAIHKNFVKECESVKHSMVSNKIKRKLSRERQICVPVRDSEENQFRITLASIQYTQCRPELPALIYHFLTLEFFFYLVLCSLKIS